MFGFACWSDEILLARTPCWRVEVNKEVFWRVLEHQRLAEHCLNTAEHEGIILANQAD
jgi:hypothetical protein